MEIYLNNQKFRAYRTSGGTAGEEERRLRQLMNDDNDSDKSEVKEREVRTSQLQGEKRRRINE